MVLAKKLRKQRNGGKNTRFNTQLVLAEGDGELVCFWFKFKSRVYGHKSTGEKSSRLVLS